MCSAYVPTGVRRAEWLHSSSRNRRDPSRHRSSPNGVVALRHNVIVGKGEAYKQLDCEVAERGAEVGAGRSSDERRNNRTRRSEGPVAGCATRPEGLRACCDAIHPSTTGGQVHAGTMSLGAFANALALRNASARLPGGEPDEGELHVRFGEGLQETSRRKGFRACFLLHILGGQRESDGVVVPLIGVQHNAPGGKGPNFDHAWEVGKHQGSTSNKLGARHEHDRGVSVQFPRQAIACRSCRGAADRASSKNREAMLAVTVTKRPTVTYRSGWMATAPPK